MPHKTKIEWADYTSNPLRARTADGKQGWACVKVGPGCAHCYAEELNKRFGTRRAFNFTAFNAAGEVEHYVDEKELRHILTFRPKPPFKNGRSRPLAFPCDMTDPFGEWNSDETIDHVLASIALRPDVDFAILTKRPERAASYLANDAQMRLTRHIGQLVCDAWERMHGKSMAMTAERGAIVTNWPLPNLILGTSVENQKAADERIPHLINCPAAARFVSAEPLLGAVDIHKFIPQRGTLGFVSPWYAERSGAKVGDAMVIEPLNGGINLLIVGGESGRGARPMDPAWARFLRDQCQAAGIPFFFKQWGGVHRRADGRLLDGREWNEFPDLPRPDDDHNSN